MKKLVIKFNFGREERIYTAVLSDDLSHPVPHPDNEALGVVDGVAEELGIWAIMFGNNCVEADFVCEIDNDGEEIKTLTPQEILLWNDQGKILHNDEIPFTVEVSQVWQ